MAREADAIYDAALRGGINPATVYGIAGAESNFGKAGYAVGRNNPYGLMGFRFPSYAAATTKLAQTLKSQSLRYPQAYRSAGGGARGLNAMIQIYTPRGAANGPNNDPDGHAINIANIGRRTGGDANTVYINPGAAPAAGPAPARPGATPGGTVAGGLDTSTLMALMRQQTQRIRAGQGYDRALGMKIRQTVIDSIGQQNVGGGRVPGSAVTGGAQQDPAIQADGAQPKLSKWGGPSDHGNRALGDWQSDLAWDLGGPTGTAIRNPLPGRVVKVSGSPGGRPQFAGYGVTVDYGGGRQAFFKHLGTLGPGIRAGARIPRGALLGGLDGRTAGGPHLHLGATNQGFLQSLLPYYGVR